MDWSRGLGLVVVAALSGAQAHATSAVRYRLAYSTNGLGGCPQAEALRDAVSARLGYVPWHDVAQRSIDVDISARTDTLRARIWMRDHLGRQTGQRELSGGRCLELAAAVELAIALAIDPLASTAPRPPPRLTPRRARARVALRPRDPPRVEVKAAPAPPPERGGPEIRLALGPTVAVGASPATAAGIMLQIDLRWRQFGLVAEGRVDFPTERQVDIGQARLSGQLSTAAVLACGHTRWLTGCALAAFGALRAEGLDLLDARRETLFHAAVGGRLLVEIPLSTRFAFGVFGDVRVNLARQILLESQTKTELWSSPPIHGAFGLALVARVR